MLWCRRQLVLADGLKADSQTFKRNCGAPLLISEEVMVSSTTSTSQMTSCAGSILLFVEPSLVHSSPT
ncbi:hypothetical protein FR483_n509R [Paramecium bursaria Chlorella virus FR483]|uniref:Uncharacterized protein n509R n=1 Tax=Paramecium bursaria Chlorella virus FR483 TaxID=399781 RepID=A7J7L3_PBCVF|nr:hypothetical protein FR483_n509R [Paramecium bursaria Chlorella virus FR483]ABT15794.1 hypothetical protein FR483_n509R [Paramecium bursaria Chlorella virus FR483]